MLLFRSFATTLAALTLLVACNAPDHPPTSPSRAFGYLERAPAPTRAGATVEVGTLRPLPLFDDEPGPHGEPSVATRACSARIDGFVTIARHALAYHKAAIVPANAHLRMDLTQAFADGSTVTSLDEKRKTFRAYTDDGHAGSFCRMDLRGFYVIGAPD